MKFRLLLIGCALASLVVAPRIAKAADDEAPVKIALIDPPNAKGTRLGGPSISHLMRASAHALIFPTTTGGDLVNKLFDLETDTVRAVDKEGIVAGGNGEWKFKGGRAPQLLVRQGADVERAYPLPAEDFEELNALPGELFDETTIVAANEESVELLVGTHCYRWNATSRALENSSYTGVPQGRPAITRDGESFIRATKRAISQFSMQTGERTRHQTLAPMKVESTYLSAFGKYALYDPDSTGDSQTWHVIETDGARELWNFVLDNWQNPVVLSPDEKWLAIGNIGRKVWEIHDLQSGAIVKELPRVPNANAAAFSPDGATLYSIADGVLYRQRAR